jgi:cation diffusion facilitator CzcD-associated flavoprotein CzcO
VVHSAHYAETNKRWHITTDTGQTYAAKYFITAVGCLSSANIPDISGLDSFAGDWFHTGEWPMEGLISQENMWASSVRVQLAFKPSL